MKIRTKLILALCLTLSFVGLCGFIVLTLVLSRAGVQAPPIHYDLTVYPSERPALCPGDTLIYTPTLVLQTGDSIPAPVTVLRSWYDIGHRRQAIDTSGVQVPVINTTRNLPGDGRYATPIRLPVPLLPPGTYELLNTITSPGRSWSGYRVRVTVPTQCPAH